jgi:tetratricopeptide (TPR) repeat protein
LELHRKCIKNCVTAISCDSKCVNAYLIQGKAYLAINKTQSAIDIWTCGLANTNNLCDCTVVSELQRCLKSATSDEVLAQQPVAAVATNNLIIESKNSTSMNQAKNNIEEFPKSSEYASPRNVTSNINEKVKVNDVIGTESESTITTSTRVQKINESNTISHSKVSSIAEFTNLNEKSDNNSRTKPGDTHPTNSVVNSVNSANTQNNHEIVIRSLHSQLVGEGQNKIAPQLITAARANLSHPSGEFYVDDLLTFGNLLVNSNQPKEALSLFHMLLNHNPNLFLACLGIGTVEAMLSHFDEAIKYFNRAIKLDPTVSSEHKFSKIFQFLMWLYLY